MFQLVLASLFFLGLHFGVAATSLRDRLIEKLGEKGYRILFASLALLGLIWLVYAWRQASYSSYIPLWGQPVLFKYLAVLLMPVAFLFVIAGITTPNPARLGQEEMIAGDFQPTGILRVSRHPMLWGIALWALLHLLANGDLAAVIFFGTFLVLAIKGSYDLDRKRLKQYGEKWQRYQEVTSLIPFQAILQGKQTLIWQELGWWRIALALVLYGGLLHAHAKLFGVAPLG